MPRSIDILIADGATTRIGRTLLRSLGKRGLVCEAIDDRPVARDSHGYLRLLKARLGEVQPKVLMPVFRGELIASNRSMVPEGTVLACGDAGTIRLLDDKVSASELCTSLGIPQPRLYSDEDALERPQMLFRTPGMPVVFKRSTGLGGDSVYFPKNGKALANIIGSAGVKGRPHLIMDYIDGYDVSVDAIRWNGWFQAVAYRTMVPKRKGTSLVRVGTDRPELIENVMKILDAVDYKGVCGVDFRIDRKTGNAYFLECNPRFSGGLKSSLAAGLDLPYAIWLLCNGEIPQTKQPKRKCISIEWEELLRKLPGIRF